MARTIGERQFLHSRRTLLIGASAAASAALLAACGGGSSATDTPVPKATAAATTAAVPAATTANVPAAIATGAAAAPSAAVATTGTTGAASPIATTGSAVALPGKRGGKVVWGLVSDPIFLIPYGAVANSTVQGREFMYDSLLEWDKDLNIKPALAESYESTDGKTYTFKLRKGVKFHDGTEMTADDVKYSLDTQINPPPPGTKSFTLNIASTEIVDKYTVKVTVPSVNPSVPGFFARGNAPIIPKDAYTKLTITSQGIGTGPYKLVEFVPNDRVVYARNPDYWKPGLPYLDEITLKVLPDEQSRLAALRSGAIDGSTFSPDIVQTVRNDKSLVVLTGLTSSPRVIQFTIKADAKKPWNDVRVRKAVSMAMNRQDIIEKVYNGDAELTGAVPPGYADWPLTKADLEKFYKQDIAGAKKLMADAGFAQGFPVTLQAISAPREYTQIAEIVREAVKQIGIDVTVQPLEIGTFAKNIGDGSFDWASTGRGIREDVSQYVNDFRPDQPNYNVWFTGGGYKNDELTKLYDDGFVLTDPAKRKPIYKRIQEIVVDEVPNMYTVQNKSFHLIRSRVKNMYVSFTNTNVGLREAWVEG